MSNPVRDPCRDPASDASPPPSGVDARRLVAERADPLWRFLAMAHPPADADVIFVFGSQAFAVPAHAAKLYQAAHAPVVLVSGSYGRMTRDRFPATEAEVFRDRLVRDGVPPGAIVTEPEAANTLENVRFGLAALRRAGVAVRRALLVAKPFVMRRCAAAFDRQAPGVAVRCCPPTTSLDASIDRETGRFAARLVGELERLDRYAAAGDITRQPIPPDVRAAAALLRRWYVPSDAARPAPSPP